MVEPSLTRVATKPTPARAIQTAPAAPQAMRVLKQDELRLVGGGPIIKNTGQ